MKGYDTSGAQLALASARRMTPNRITKTAGKVRLNNRSTADLRQRMSRILVGLSLLMIDDEPVVAGG